MAIAYLTGSLKQSIVPRLLALVWLCLVSPEGPRTPLPALSNYRVRVCVNNFEARIYRVRVRVNFEARNTVKQIFCERNFAATVKMFSLSLHSSISISLSLSLFYIHCTYSSIDLSLSFNFIFWLLIFCVDCFLKHPYKRFCFFIFFTFTTRDLSLHSSISISGAILITHTGPKHLRISKIMMPSHETCRYSLSCVNLLLTVYLYHCLYLSPIGLTV